MKLNSMAALWAGHNQIYYIAKHLIPRFEILLNFFWICYAANVTKNKDVWQKIDGVNMKLLLLWEKIE